MRMREVFVPGGLPRHTYVPREALRLEERLRAATDNLCKLVTITGPTKSGKSVLTQQIFPRDRAIWIDGGSISKEEEIWADIVSQAGGFTGHSTSATKATAAGASAEAKAQLGFSWLAKGEASFTPSISQERTSEIAQTREDTPKGAAIRILRQTKRPLVFDDFHYLDREKQGEVIRALKQLIFDGCPVIMLAIPHRKHDPVRVEREMTGRVEHIDIPEWKPEELASIPEIGFKLLNVTVADRVVDEFANEALGSPHLMQDFCRHICEMSDIEESARSATAIPQDANIHRLFRTVAESTSKAIFERLSRGPRQRSDRKVRTFVDNTTGDIYVAVLKAIALCKPGMSSIPYEVIRSKLREILKSEVPQMSQVSQVIERMSEISATDKSSVPVLEWDNDQRELHITDPFFAFFLKWGLPS